MKKHLLSISALVLAASASYGQIIVYNFNTSDSTPDSTITGIGADVAATSITAVDLGPFGGNPGWGITSSSPTVDGSYAFVRGTSVLGTTDPGTANVDYFGFTISANTGTFNVTGASVDARGTGNDFSFALRSSADGYASDLLTGSTTSSTFVNFENTAISGISNQTSTDFRFYMWVNGGADTTPLRFDNLSVTVAPIPEPSSFALLAGALGGIALLRRKRR